MPFRPAIESASLEKPIASDNFSGSRTLFTMTILNSQEKRRRSFYESDLGGTLLLTDRLRESFVALFTRSQSGLVGALKGLW
jgi:hypothetical protein